MTQKRREWWWDINHDSDNCNSTTTKQDDDDVKAEGGKNGDSDVKKTIGGDEKATNIDIWVSTYQ